MGSITTVTGNQRKGVCSGHAFGRNDNDVTSSEERCLEIFSETGPCVQG